MNHPNPYLQVPRIFLDQQPWQTVHTLPIIRVLGGRQMAWQIVLWSVHQWPFSCTETNFSTSHRRLRKSQYVLNELVIFVSDWALADHLSLIAGEDVCFVAFSWISKDWWIHIFAPRQTLRNSQKPAKDTCSMDVEMETAKLRRWCRRTDV